jgi:hypothetical protein
MLTAHSKLMRGSNQLDSVQNFLNDFFIVIMASEVYQEQLQTIVAG